MKCLICNQEFSEPSHFWKNHKIKEKDYYEKYFPKFDLLTEEKLLFKNAESYLFNDFLNKNNLKKYITSLPPENAAIYIKLLLSRRVRTKNLMYELSQVELRSLQMPSLITYHKLLNWADLCNELVLKLKYISLSPDYKLPNISKDDLIINVDTRENHVLNLSKKTELKKLDFGDYGVDGGDLFIERKSLSDFIGTLSAGFERFEKEIQRSVDNKCSLFILIEDKMDNALAFDKLPWMSKKIKATPSFIFHNVRYLIQKYPNIQFIFVEGRKKAANLIERMLSFPNIFKEIDVQYALDIKAVEI